MNQDQDPGNSAHWDTWTTTSTEMRRSLRDRAFGEAPRPQHVGVDFPGQIDWKSLHDAGWRPHTYIDALGHRRVRIPDHLQDHFEPWHVEYPAKRWSLTKVALEWVQNALAGLTYRLNRL